MKVGVAFLSHILAQYRTHKPYPYHRQNILDFLWTCIPIIAAGIPATRENVLFCYVFKDKTG